MKTLRIALYPGDGIGPEATAAAVAVLQAAAKTGGGFGLEFAHFNWGVADHERLDTATLTGRIIAALA